MSAGEPGTIFASSTAAASDRSVPSRVVIHAAAPVVGLAIGIAATTIGPGWRDPWLWSPDLAVGVGFFALAGYAWDRHRPFAIVTLALGLTWFAGTALPFALYWHRGPLVHVLLAFPAARPSRAWALIAVGVGYVAAAVPIAWGSDIGASILTVSLVVVLACLVPRTSGRHRADRFRAFAAGSVFASAVAGGMVARTIVASHGAVLPSLVAYDFAMIVIAVLLGLGLRPPDAARVTDLVVDLADQPLESFRDALARAFGDPALQVGVWDGQGSFRDPTGTTISLPSSDAPMTVTRIDRDGAPHLVLVHESTLLEDRRLRDALTAAVLLIAANDDLHDRMRHRVVEVAASRQRLVIAADDERRRLGAEIDASILTSVEELIARLERKLVESIADPRARTALESAHELLERARVAVVDAVRGLRPRELDEGLVPALTALSARSVVDVTVVGSAPRLRPEIEAAAYYACVEAITNAAKHASATSVTVSVGGDVDALVVTVSDDGIGGADPSRGTGLAGIADRVASLGGEVGIHSRDRQGTRVTIRLPSATDQAPRG
jgi:signal transduction histidine kinase